MITATIAPLTSEQLAAARTDAGEAGQAARATAQLAQMVEAYQSAELVICARQILQCDVADIAEVHEDMMAIGHKITELRQEMANRGWLPSRGQAASPQQRESWVWAMVEQEMDDWNETLEQNRPEVYREY